MANAAALIRESLWRDRDFRALPRLAQCMYLQLLSQKDLDCAGILTLHLELLAKGCDEWTFSDIRDDLEALEVARFVFVDEDTDELLIRSYMRLVSIKSPNAWKSAFKSARMIQSPKLRVELAQELRRIRRKDAESLAEELDPIGNPSESHSDPIGNPSEGDIPSESHSEPPRSVPVIGHLSLRTTQVGEAPPKCRKHETNSEEPCEACRRRRIWEADNDERIAAQERAERERLYNLAQNCTRCGGTNLIEVADNEVRKCDHQPEVVLSA